MELVSRKIEWNFWVISYRQSAQVPNNALNRSDGNRQGTRRITEFNRVKDRSRAIKRYGNDFQKPKNKTQKKSLISSFSCCSRFILSAMRINSYIEKKGGNCFIAVLTGFPLSSLFRLLCLVVFQHSESGSRLDTFFSIANGESTISHGAHNGGHNGRQPSLS